MINTDIGIHSAILGTLSPEKKKACEKDSNGTIRKSISEIVAEGDTPAKMRRSAMEQAPWSKEFLTFHELYKAILEKCELKNIPLTTSYNPTAPAYTSLDKKTGKPKTTVSPFFFLNWEELLSGAKGDETFKINDMDDPKLQDKGYFQDLYNYMQARTGVPEKNNIGPLDIAHMLGFIQLNQAAKDAPTLVAAIETMLTHELGHIANKDNVADEELEAAYKVRKKFLLCILLLLPAYILGRIALWTHYKIKCIFHERMCEERADLFAKDKVDNAKLGAEYGFGCVQKVNAHLHTCKALTKVQRLAVRLILNKDKGTPHQRLTHGNLTTRIRRFQP